MKKFEHYVSLAARMHTVEECGAPKTASLCNLETDKQCNHGIESISSNAIAEFDCGACKRLSRNIDNVLRQSYLLIQGMAGTVIAKASVETISMAAASDWAALYRAAKSTTTVASGKLFSFTILADIPFSHDAPSQLCARSSVHVPA